MFQERKIAFFHTLPVDPRNVEKAETGSPTSSNLKPRLYQKIKKKTLLKRSLLSKTFDEGTMNV